MKKILLFTLLLGLSALILIGCQQGATPDDQPDSVPDDTQETEIEDSETEPVEVPEGCTSWYDGCNTCTVVEGELAACTLMYCSPEAMEEPKCLEPAEESDSEVVIPEGCTSWYDGCNTCSVGEGELSACTMMYCTPEVMKEPKCLKYAEESDSEVVIPEGCTS